MHRFKFSSLISLSSVFVITIAVVASCVSHDLGTPCTTTVSYSADIAPIVETKCAISGCHNGDQGASLDWTDFNTFQSRSQDVKRAVVDRVMPPSDSPAGPLSQDQINLISCWVDQGANNN